MENAENSFEQSVPPPNPTLQPKWFHNAWISRSTLLVAGLFFLMPFITINCSGNKLASIRGMDMVIGSELKPEFPAAPEQKIEEKAKDTVAAIGDSVAQALKGMGDSVSVNLTTSTDSLSLNLNALGDSLAAGLNSIGDSLEKGLGEMAKAESPFNMMPAMGADMMGGKGKRIEPNALAIGSFAFILLALVFSFFKGRAMAITSGIIAVLSAVALFFIQVQISTEIQKEMGPFNFVPITVEFTSFYWLSILLIALAGVFSFIRSSFKSV